LQKRWAPFDRGINTIYWSTRVIEWLYRQADNLPVRIQQHIDREYRSKHEKLWQEKSDDADELVKMTLAQEFPDFFRRRYIDPYEEGSQIREENEAFMQRIQYYSDVDED
jgi:hypothetical protein